MHMKDPESFRTVAVLGASAKRIRRLVVDASL